MKYTREGDSDIVYGKYFGCGYRDTNLEGLYSNLLYLISKISGLSSLHNTSYIKENEFWELLAFFVCISTGKISTFLILGLTIH